MPKYRLKRHSVTQPTDTSYRLIPLTQGKNAIVDAEDFEWLNQWNWVAWRAKPSQTFYATRGEGPRKNHKRIYMHRQIMKAVRRQQCDHRNRNGLDNRKSNLRIASITQNNWNTGVRRRNKCGFKGVHFTAKGKWSAGIMENGRRHFLGDFDTAEKAAHAYDKAAKTYYGEFAFLNFPSHSSKSSASIG